ncbi:MAG: hypothetical protein ACFB21_06695, partial [Opitutales bacterium]
MRRVSVSFRFTAICRFCATCLLGVWAGVATAQRLPEGFMPPDPEPPPVPETIRSVKQLRSLTPEQAELEVPVSITGVITYFEPLRSLYFIQDETGGTYFESSLIWEEDSGDAQPRPGDLFQVNGVSSAGGYAPIIVGPAFAPPRYLGRSRMPEPAPLDPSRLLAPELEAQFVEVPGVVRALGGGGR